MKSIFITGANGFVGSYLCAEALNRGYITYAAIRKGANRKYLPKEVIILEIDFTNVESIKKSIPGSDKIQLPFNYVIHNAGVTKAIRKEDFYRGNYINTKNLIDVLVKDKLVIEKFIYISSLAAYGPAEFNNGEPVNLVQEPHPVTDYGKSKLKAERYLQSQEEFPYLIFRPTGIYGPGDRAYLQVIKLINNHLITHLGSGSNVLTFIHIKDLSRLILDGVENSVSNRSYFVTDGHSYSQFEFEEMIKQILNKKTITLRVPLPITRIIALVMEGMSLVTGKVPILTRGKIPELTAKSWECDVKPMIEDFGFKPEFDLKKGFTETINWYKSIGWL